ncbi:MAG TPA: TlpA disulfide reductase family protein, partial [Chitinophagaceae bacterium]|nr:TlpA disulfide reductase family protein [Chitinophagaceae bacterium]
IVAYVNANPSSVIGAWAVTRNFLYEPDANLLSTLFQSMDSSVKQTSYGKLIDTTMQIARELEIGKVAPDFTQNDPQGKPISLSSLRGKYVLIDFWASWCGPCRAENPNVVKAYNQNKDKGFTILGVSLDKKKEPWIKAIQDDHLDWNQVSDLNFWNNQVAKQYGIRAIPSNFLLDKDGKILYRNLRGKKLDLALSGIFK